MLSASAVAALSVGSFALLKVPLSHSNSVFLLIGSLHRPLRLAFLPLFNHPPITYPLPRCSIGHSSAHPLCHRIRLHLLRLHDLPNLYASRGIILGNSSPARLASFLSLRHRQGLISHGASLRRAPLRQGHHRIRMATLGQRTRFT